MYYYYKGSDFKIKPILTGNKYKNVYKYIVRIYSTLFFQYICAYLYLVYAYYIIFLAKLTISYNLFNYISFKFLDFIK